MTISARALTLTIDANSEQDMVMLLKQALYEIEQSLPVPLDAPIDVRNASSARKFMATASENRVINGHTAGSIGTYNFEFLNSSRAYHTLEQRLFSEGYVTATGNNWMKRPYFAHPTLPPKCIDGIDMIDAPEHVYKPDFV